MRLTALDRVVKVGREMDGTALVRLTALDRAVKVGQEMDGSSLRW